ncbi:hypothetical protein [Streptomyces sp. SBT349]|uniref:hypothetical protein n=1 Tax=Streptomyces sp. SBT349 TaxID=1580539 RepID=UPI000B022667|nr:hypothetical protein [Streptomyces sp. SBT349]
MTQLTASNAVSALHTLAEEGGRHASLNPYAIGGGALGALLLLLWITTRLNRDR